MTITEQVNNKLHKYQKKSGKSFWQIHKDMTLKGIDISYNTFRAFTSGKSVNTETLDLIEGYINKTEEK